LLLLLLLRCKQQVFKNSRTCLWDWKSHMPEDHSHIITLFLASEFFWKTCIVQNGFHRLSPVYYMHMNKKKKKKKRSRNKKEKEKKRRRRRNSSLPHKEQIAHILLSITNKMQCYTIFFITVNALHVSEGFSAHHQELKTVHTASGICQACLLLPLACVSSPTLAVAASKPCTYPMLCAQFLSSWYWAEELPETCRALTIIKNFV